MMTWVVVRRSGKSSSRRGFVPWRHRGEEALDIIREELIHLALLDVHLPRMTGLETLLLLHQINAVLPCILVIADASEALMREAFRVRAYSVIPKPVSKNVVLYTVVRALMRAYGRAITDVAAQED